MNNAMMNNAMQMASSLKDPSEKYQLLESVDVEKNITHIGDEILKVLTPDRMKNIEEIKNNPENIKKQIRRDLIYIYYDHDNNEKVTFEPTKVRNDIKTQIIQKWYTGLKLRQNYIINDLKYLLNNHDKIMEVASKQKGGGFSLKNGLSELKDRVSDGVSAVKNSVSSNMTKNVLAEMQPDDLEQTDNIEQTDNTEPDDNKKKDPEFYFNELIKYKAMLLKTEIEIKKHSQYYTSGTQTVYLHSRILNKVLQHYSGIPRKYLSSTLRRILLGDNAIGYINLFKNKVPYNPNPTIIVGIYDLFMGRVTALGNEDIAKLIGNKLEVGLDIKNTIEKQYLPEGGSIDQNGDYIFNSTAGFQRYKRDDYNDYSKSNTHFPNPFYDKSGNKYYLENPAFIGGNGEIPNYMPTSYIWKRIKKYVQKEYKTFIKDSLNSNSTAIKDAFKDVFRVVNCDALRFYESPNTDEISKYLNEYYCEILETLCMQIPNNYAVNILQNCLKFGFTQITDLLKSEVFNVQPDTYHSVRDFSFFANAFLTSTQLRLESPAFYYDKSYLGNTKINEYVSKLEKCCKSKIEEIDRTPNDQTIPEILKVNAHAIHLTLKNGLDGLLSSFITPSPNKQYMELPVFEVLKKQFMQCSNDVAFLAELFNMYSARSITFMQKVQGQFFNENIELNQYILTCVLTKHPYTVKIVSECIKHTADLVLKIKTEFDAETISNYASIYCAILIYTASVTEFKSIKPSNNPKEENTYIQHMLVSYRNLSIQLGLTSNDTIGAIFNQLTEKDKKTVNEDLKRIFALNSVKLFAANTQPPAQPTVSSNTQPITQPTVQPTASSNTQPITQPPAQPTASSNAQPITTPTPPSNENNTQQQLNEKFEKIKAKNLELITLVKKIQEELQKLLDGDEKTVMIQSMQNIENELKSQLPKLGSSLSFTNFMQKIKPLNAVLQLNENFEKINAKNLELLKTVKKNQDELQKLPDSEFKRLTIESMKVIEEELNSQISAVNSTQKK